MDARANGVAPKPRDANGEDANRVRVRRARCVAGTETTARRYIFPRLRRAGARERRRVAECRSRNGRHQSPPSPSPIVVANTRRWRKKFINHPSRAVIDPRNRACTAHIGIARTHRRRRRRRRRFARRARAAPATTTGVVSRVRKQGDRRPTTPTTAKRRWKDLSRPRACALVAIGRSRARGRQIFAGRSVRCARTPATPRTTTCSVLAESAYSGRASRMCRSGLHTRAYHT